MTPIDELLLQMAIEIRPTRSGLFWAKVDKSGECWLWTGSTKPSGYGSFWNGARLVPAHRWAYEEVNGAVARDLDMDHLCRVRACVRPEHLEPVTRLENVRRGLGPVVTGARMAAKTHCPQGHPYSGENLYLFSDGRRACRECRAAHGRAVNAMRTPKPPKTNCVNGHPFIGDNLITSKEGHRFCKECRRVNSLRNWHRRVARAKAS